jgi:hypothetical protein
MPFIGVDYFRQKLASGGKQRSLLLERRIQVWGKRKRHLSLPRNRGAFRRRRRGSSPENRVLTNLLLMIGIGHTQEMQGV